MRETLRSVSSTIVPQTSFGPLRLLPALPWLILAAAMRVIAFAGGPASLPALVVAAVAVLHAFIVTAQRCIEASGGQTNLGELSVTDQLRLSLAVLWRIALLMIAAALALVFTPYAGQSPHLMAGLDGMAFDQFTHLGRFWSAFIAALVLLMILQAERNNGRTAFFPALGEFARRGLWLGTAVLVLGLVNIGLGYGQNAVRSLIWTFGQTEASQFAKNLVFFVFIFSFAMLRLWVTLSIVTFGLKASYVYGEND
ncbi:hypothetical protein ACQR0V_05955 [Bradyrhizobium sp. HKCCYLS2058]|uniref:hypothetical protein n=1 Tax=Bradyrhizobium TaxID=374 RepID=UPI0029166A59|nr:MULTISPECIES: hypothetical protein [unclassified Bradyrhizobium]